MNQLGDPEIDHHPDLRALDRPQGFGPRARWRAYRNRARLRRQWRGQEVLRRQRRRTTLLIIGVVAPIAVVALVTYRDELMGVAGRDAMSNTAPPTATTSAPSGEISLDRPFAGTPAADWQDGMRGITVPKAA